MVYVVLLQIYSHLYCKGFHSEMESQQVKAILFQALAGLPYPCS